MSDTQLIIVGIACVILGYAALVFDSPLAAIAPFVISQIYLVGGSIVKSIN